MLFRSTYARHRIRHGIRHTAALAGRRPCQPVATGRLRHRLIGSARVSTADGSPSLAVPCDALQAPAPRDLSVSNSLSGRHWELDQVPAVGDPTDIVQFGTGYHLAAGEGRRRVALQRRVAAYLVVGGLEVGKCPFKITGIPKQHMVETFSPRRADQALHEWVGPRESSPFLVKTLRDS